MLISSTNERAGSDLGLLIQDELNASAGFPELSFWHILKWGVIEKKINWVLTESVAVCFDAGEPNPIYLA